MANVRLWASVMILMFSAGECFQWTGSLQDSAFVAACVDGNVSLPWTFTLSSGETIEDIKWNFRSATGQQELVAMFVGGTFNALPSFSQRVQYLTNGGLVLRNLTGGDSGNFTVGVVVRESFKIIRDYTRTAEVEVADGLRVREDPNPAYDPVADSWHVSLSCGIIANPDGSRDHIQWQTPSGVVPSTRYEAGHFYLQLENPVMGGNYTCGLAPRATANICLPLWSQQKATIFVDECKVRVSLLEAENKQIRTENTEMKTAFSDLRQLVKSLVNTTTMLQGKVSR